MLELLYSLVKTLALNIRIRTRNCGNTYVAFDTNTRETNVVKIEKIAGYASQEQKR